MRSRLQSVIVGLIALAVLIALAGVLVSPAVPSAPTLLPINGLFLIGLVVLAYHAAARKPGAVLAVIGSAKPAARLAGLNFVCTSLPLRR